MVKRQYCGIPTKTINKHPILIENLMKNQMKLFISMLANFIKREKIRVLPLKVMSSVGKKVISRSIVYSNGR